MAINHHRPQIRQGPHFRPWTLVTTRAHLNPSPQLKGNPFHSAMHPVLKVAGVVHIWYYIPLCTIFYQKFNGDVARTKFHESKLKVPKSKAHFIGGVFSSSVLQSMAASRRLFKDPNHLALQELGGQFNSGLLKGPFLRGITSFQLVFKAESTSASLGQFNWSIQVILKYPVWPWPNWADSVPQFSFQDGQNCIGPIQTIQTVTHLPGSALQLFTYTGHLSSPGDFFPS
ncbi:hypothetical protein O181_114091 [Austropuccinia psidii MF-1]|uniref:Uncharacterized protein n=1 Tax=Austropuccinia psidii MF-1 TaxID=1389203 RepID=A0A9Q3K676_9BASI|nr:hypothetical protein [Austropuccinia psidii MF-1]